MPNSLHHHKNRLLQTLIQTYERLAYLPIIEHAQKMEAVSKKNKQIRKRARKEELLDQLVEQYDLFFKNNSADLIFFNLNALDDLPFFQNRLTAFCQKHQENPTLSTALHDFKNITLRDQVTDLEKELKALKKKDSKQWIASFKAFLKRLNAQIDRHILPNKIRRTIEPITVHPTFQDPEKVLNDYLSQPKSYLTDFSPINQILETHSHHPDMLEILNLFHSYLKKEYADKNQRRVNAGVEYQVADEFEKIAYDQLLQNIEQQIQTLEFNIGDALQKCYKNWLHHKRKYIKLFSTILSYQDSPKPIHLWALSQLQKKIHQDNPALTHRSTGEYHRLNNLLKTVISSLEKKLSIDPTTAKEGITADILPIGSPMSIGSSLFREILSTAQHIPLHHPLKTMQVFLLLSAGQIGAAMTLANQPTQNHPSPTDHSIQQIIDMDPSEWYQLYDHVELMIQTCLDQKTRNQLSRKDQDQFFHFLKDALGLGGKVKLSGESIKNLLKIIHDSLTSRQYYVNKIEDIKPLHDLFNALLRIDTPDQKAQHAILTQVSQYAQYVAHIPQPFVDQKNIRNMQDLIWMLHVTFDWYIHKVANTISSDEIKDLFKNIEQLNFALPRWSSDDIFLFRTVLSTNRRMRDVYRDDKAICQFLDQSTQTFVQHILQLVEHKEIRIAKKEIQESVYIEYVRKLNENVQRAFNPKFYQRIEAGDVFPYEKIYVYTIPNSSIRVKIFSNKLSEENKAIVATTLTNTYQRMEEFKHSIGLSSKDDKRNPLFDLYLFDDHEHYVKYGPIWNVNTGGGGYAHVIHRDNLMAYEAFIYQQPEGDPRNGKNKEGRNFRNLGHEIQHQFSYALLGSHNLNRLPSWMIEGMANALGNEPCFNEEAQYIRTAAIQEEPKKIIHMEYSHGADLYYFGSTLFQFMKDHDPQRLQLIFQAAQQEKSEEVNRLVKEWGEAPATNTAYTKWLDEKIMSCLPEKDKIKDPSSLKEGGQAFLNSATRTSDAIHLYKIPLRFDFGPQDSYDLSHEHGFYRLSNLASNRSDDRSAMNKIWIGLLIYGTELKLQQEIPGINNQDCTNKVIDLLGISQQIYDRLHLKQMTFNQQGHDRDLKEKQLIHRPWLNNPSIKKNTENVVKQYNPYFNFQTFYKEERMTIKKARLASTPHSKQTPHHQIEDQEEERMQADFDVLGDQENNRSLEEYIPWSNKHEQGFKGANQTQTPNPITEKKQTQTILNLLQDRINQLEQDLEQSKQYEQQLAQTKNIHITMLIEKKNNQQQLKQNLLTAKMQLVQTQENTQTILGPLQDRINQLEWDLEQLKLHEQQLEKTIQLLKTRLTNERNHQQQLKQNLLTLKIQLIQNPKNMQIILDSSQHPTEHLEQTLEQLKNHEQLLTQTNRSRTKNLKNHKPPCKEHPLNTMRLFTYSCTNTTAVTVTPIHTEPSEPSMAEGVRNIIMGVVGFVCTFSAVGLWGFKHRKRLLQQKNERTSLQKLDAYG